MVCVKAMNIQPQTSTKFLNLNIMNKFGVIELSINEMIVIDGGKTVSYYIGFTVGAIAGTVVSFLAGFGAGLTDNHN